MELVKEIGDISVEADEGYVRVLVDDECVLFMDREEHCGLGDLAAVLNSLTIKGKE